MTPRLTHAQCLARPRPVQSITESTSCRAHLYRRLPHILPGSQPGSVDRHASSADQPEERVHQINPYGVLHAGDAAIALRVRVDVHLAKQAEERDPKYEEQRIPDEEEWHSRDEWNHV
jgi:hypothetical protein